MLRDQEPLIRTYVDLLINRLHRRIQNNRPTVDLVSWYNWTTFDLIGDLAFGVPFNCLRDESYHFLSAIYFNISKPTTLSEWPRSTHGYDVGGAVNAERLGEGNR